MQLKSLFLGVSALLAVAASAQQAPANMVDLTFSLDDGKSWSDDFPSLPKPGVFLVKATLASGEKRPVADGVVTTSLCCGERDFASANSGAQDLSGRKIWVQKLQKNYTGFMRPDPFVYPVDLRSRPAGLSLRMDAPLPPCPAFAPGSYKFTVKFAYRLKDGGKQVETFADFMATVGGKAAVVPPPAKLAAAPKPLDCPMPQPGGDYVFPVSKLKTPQGAAAKPGDLVYAKNLDLNWFAEGVPEGDYYVRLVIQTGLNGGEGNGLLLYLNGVPVHFDALTGPVFHQGRWFAVAQSSSPVKIRPGDCLRLDRSNLLACGALSLSKDKWDDAVGPASGFADPFHDDWARLSGSFKLGDGGKAVFKAEIVNMTGSEGKFSVRCRVRDYFQNVVAEEGFEASIPYGGTIGRELAFNYGASDRYLASVEVTAPDGKKTDAEFEALATKTAGPRGKLWLVDNWDCAALKDAGPSSRTLARHPDANAIHRTVSLPFNYNTLGKDCHLAWFKRGFELPAVWEGRKVFVHIDRALYESELWVNGEKVAERKLPDGVGPFDIDVTKQLRFGGKNELLIGMRDQTALLYDDALNQPVLQAPTCDMKLRAYVGMRPGLGEVWLDAVPQTYVGDVFVKTSFRKRAIAAEVKVASESQGLTVAARVLRQGKELFRFKDAPAAPGVTLLSGDWAEPPLWGPDEFPLLDFEVTLKDASGKVLDVSDTRFGFRELWADGMDLLWNGKVVKFGSRPFLSSWGRNADRAANRQTIRAALRGGCRMLRHIYNANEYPDIADEEGMLVTLSPGMSPAGMNVQTVTNDEYWDNLFAVCAGGVLGMRNHPSVFTWYLSNECMAQSEAPQRDRLARHGDKLLKLDNTRFVEFGCDIDLRGYTELISTHYPVDKDVCRVDRVWFPEAAYWRRFGQEFRRGMMVPAGMLKGVANVFGESPIMWGVKPIIINECCWISFFNPPNGLSKIDGDRVYTGLTALHQAHINANTLCVQGHRDAGVSAITLWTHVGSNPNPVSIPDVDIVVLQKIDKFYAGAEVAYDVNIFHDRFLRAALEFSWSLKRGQETLDSGTEDMDADFCALFRRRLKLSMPEVAAETPLVLELAVKEAGSVLRRRVMPLTVYPRSVGKFATGVKTLLFDPAGLSAKELSATFSGIERTDALTAEKLADAKLLILGRDLPADGLGGVKKLLDDYLAKGGTVLVLSQKDIRPLFPFATQTTDLNASKCFTFRPGHPLIEGLTSDELNYWAPDHKTADHCYLKPSRGNFRVAVEAGGTNGLVYAALWDARVGEGTVVFSQMALDSNLSANPAPLKLWRNLFKYAAMPEPGLKPLGYLGGASFKSALQASGASVKDISTPADLEGCAALAVDTAEPLAADKVALAKSYLERGGKLWLHGVGDAAGACVGEPVAFDPNIPRNWLGRLALRGGDPLTSGLTNFDFFWKRAPDTEDMGPLFGSPAQNLAQPGAARISCAGGVPLCYPEFLLRKKVGRGTAYLDTLAFADLPPELKDHSSRIMATLLTNLGVSVDMTTVGTRDFFACMAFEPVDISRHMNREFADKVENDGEGGWSDQGPEADLCAFTYPKGVHTFKDVPFLVNRPLGCVVLASKNRKAGPPESVELPVGKKCDALYFLHSCAWTSRGHHASYVVNYADGSSHEIKLVGGVNLRDWGSSSPDAPFVGETETQTQTAVTVKQERLGSASLYQMAWLNPFPAKEVKAVTFKSMNQGVPILVGLTVGVRQAETKTAGDAAAAKELIERGYRLQAERKWAEAIPLFRKALAAYPQGLEPYMQIGRCHEALGDWGSAVKVYRETLKVDINQPPAMAALERAKKNLEEQRK